MIRLDSTDKETIIEALIYLWKHARAQKVLCHSAPIQEEYERQEANALEVLTKYYCDHQIIGNKEVLRAIGGKAMREDIEANAPEGEENE